MKTLIVSRHPGAIAFAQADSRFANAAVLPQASADDVRGAVVAGNLPLHLAALCGEYHAIELPAVAFSDRGKDLTVPQMIEAGARIVQYRVEVVR